MTRLLAALATLAFAQPVLAASPPSDAKPLSEIIRALEDSGEVAYFDDIDWDDDDGYWEIEYHRPDGSEVEVEIDPISGEPRR